MTGSAVVKSTTAATKAIAIANAEPMTIEEEKALLMKILADGKEKMRLPMAASSSKQVAATAEEKAAADSKSVFVGNVYFGITADTLARHFASCGSVERTTMLRDKFSGKPKGFAYVQFTEESSVQKALALDGSKLYGRPIKVTQKRTNQPRMSSQPSTRGAAAVGAVRGGRGKMVYGRSSHNPVTVKYVYVNGLPQRGGRGMRGRFAPY